MAKPKTPDVLTISQAAKAAELPAHQIRAAIKSPKNTLRSSMKEGVYQIRLVDLKAWKAAKPQPAFVDPEEVIRKAVEARQLAESMTVEQACSSVGVTKQQVQSLIERQTEEAILQRIEEAVSKALADHMPDLSEDMLRMCAERLGFKLVSSDLSVMDLSGKAPHMAQVYEIEDGPRKPFSRDEEELERLMRLSG